MIVKRADASEEFRQVLEKVHATGVYQELLESIPYASMLGVQLTTFGRDVIFDLPANEDNLGNPLLPALHGGAVGGFMEVAASVHLVITQMLPAMPKIVDFSIDFLRAGRHQNLYAECELIRQGSRVANVYVRAWQTRREDAIATARAHFLMVD